ncbi:MAG: DUF3606 domain-containing protein [Myxococcales bacterium]|nr:MAG: DUF3606 domain-containing protein [Myxococcales bacterium]
MRSRYLGARDFIDLEDPAALRHFTRVLGCSLEQLRAAVAAVGPGFANVRLRFRRRPMTRHHHLSRSA